MIDDSNIEHKCKQLSVLIFNGFYHLIISYKYNLITLKKTYKLKLVCYD